MGRIAGWAGCKVQPRGVLGVLCLLQICPWGVLASWENYLYDTDMSIDKVVLEQSLQGISPWGVLWPLPVELVFVRQSSEYVCSWVGG